MSELIRVNELYKEYRMSDVSVKALNGVDLEINKGEFVALTGSSGSGKSTLMNILGCLDIPTSGGYYLNGEDIAKASDAKLAEIRNKNLGFVFQDFNLISNMSAIDNVALPYKYAKMSSSKSLKKARLALEKVGLGDRVHHKPFELSGGQQQRVAFARALLCDPPILLADEPTGNLDSKTTVEILDLICELNEKGTTVVMVTHERDVAEIAKREIVLLDGKIKDEVMR